MTKPILTRALDEMHTLEIYVDYHKPEGRPGYITLSWKRWKDDGGHFRSFTFQMFSGPSINFGEVKLQTDMARKSVKALALYEGRVAAAGDAVLEAIIAGRFSEIPALLPA